MRHYRIIALLALNALFASSIAFASVWFNTDIGRFGTSDSEVRDQMPERGRQNLSLTSDLRPLTSDLSVPIWLSVRTNIAGYTFVPEPASDDVKQALGTEKIVSGTFVRTAEFVRTQESEVSRQKSALTSDIRPLTSETAPLPDRVTVFLASWTARDKPGLTALQHTPDICWVGSGWKPIDTGQPPQLPIPLADSMSEFRIQKPALTSDLRPLSLGTGFRRPLADSTAPSDRPSELPSIRSSVDPSLSPSSPRTSEPALVPWFSAQDPIALPFTCRAFSSPDGKSVEFAAWCAFVGGRPIAEPISNVAEDSDSEIWRAYEKRKAAFWTFWQVLESRSPASATRQFARVSTGLAGNATTAAAALCGFSRLALAGE